jgi:hypothetical protein
MALISVGWSVMLASEEVAGDGAAGAALGEVLGAGAAVSGWAGAGASAAGLRAGSGVGAGVGAGGWGGCGVVCGGGAGGMGAAGVKLLSWAWSAKGAAMMRVSSAGDFSPLMSCGRRGKPHSSSAWPMAATAAATASWRCGGLGVVGAMAAVGAVKALGA